VLGLDVACDDVRLGSWMRVDGVRVGSGFVTEGVIVALSFRSSLSIRAWVGGLRCAFSDTVGRMLCSDWWCRVGKCMATMKR
jgi:hypothetical protein